MKIINKAYLLIVLAPLVLTGCSSKSSNTTSTSSTLSQNSGQEISDIEPTLKQTGFVRQQLTDPILYSYLQATNKGSTEFVQGGNLAQAALARVGRQGNFSKKQKYEFSGIVQIVSVDKLAFKSITYNGGCGLISFNPTNSTNFTKPFSSVYNLQSAVSGANFEASIPSTLNLTQFDSISVFCSNNPEEPISTANL